MGALRGVLIGATTAAVLFTSAVKATPTVRQHKWLILGPIQNSGDCWGEIGDPPPVPGHDVAAEHPRAGDDWASPDVPFTSGAPTRWLDLSTAPQFECVCFNLLFARDLGLRLAKDRTKAIAVTYAVNRTAAPIPIQVCSGTYNESILVYVNRSLVTRAITCSGDTSGRECRNLDPAVLLPGKNQITVVSYEGGYDWGIGVRLKRLDGTNIDDATDPDVSFTNDPEDCLDVPAPAERTIAERCSSGGTQVTIRAPEGGDPAEVVSVVEDVDGMAAVSGISNGGRVTGVSRIPSSCGGEPKPVGLFTDSHDVGGPCFLGSTVFDPAERSYSMKAGGRDIFDGGDQFQFAYLHARGDFSMSVRIAETPALPPSRYGKFGIMARQDCSANSRYCGVLDLSRNTDGSDPDSYDFQWRANHGAVHSGSTGYVLGSPQTFDGHPEYLRLDRAGSKFTAFVAGDRSLNWEKAGEFDWGAGAPCDVLLGLAVSSHAWCSPIEVRFDAVGYVGGSFPCQIADNRDIGGPCVQGSTAFNLATRSYAVKGGGSDIWNNGDQFQFASLKARGNFSMSARIAHRSFDPGAGQVLPPSRWGKFGIIARQDEGAASRYTAVLDNSLDTDGTDPDSYSLQGRSAHGAAGTSFSVPPSGAIKHPGFVRLDRSGSRFIGYGSTDGSTWEKVAEHDWGVDAPCEVHLGFAVTSHGSCGSIEVLFDSVSLAGGDEPCGGRIEWDVSRGDLSAGLSYSIENLQGDDPGVVRLWGRDDRGAISGPREVDLGRNVEAEPGPDFRRAIDVGGATGGSTTYNPDQKVYTTVSSGDDISDAGDRFHFAYKEIAGDFDLIVQVLERIEPPDRDHYPAGRIGLMARKDCLGDSKHCHIQTPSGESALVVPALVYRLAHGTNITTIDRNQFNAAQVDYRDVGQRPSYQRLVRVGNTFYALLSRDGNAWELLGRDTWANQDPAEPILVGFAAASGRNFRNGLSPSTTIRYRVVWWETLDAPPPFDDDGLAAAETLFEERFDALDAARWSAQGREVNGLPQAAPSTRRLQLTHDEFCCPHVTSAFSRTPLEGIDRRIFEFEFDAYLTNQQAGTAEGFTFTVSSGTTSNRLSDTLGLRGAGVGYDGLNRKDQGAANSNSFAVEFDCAADGEWNGGLGSWTSPGRWHLGIDSGNLALVSHVFTSDVPDIFDPMGVHCRIRYNRGLVQVWVASNKPLPGGGPDPAGPAPPTIEARVLPLSFSMPNERAVFGFTAGTGGEKVICEVDNLRVVSIPENDIPELASIGFPAPPLVRVGESFTLDGSGSNGGAGDEPMVAAYRWQVLSGPGEVAGAADGSEASVRATGSDGPIVVMLSVDDGRGPAPPEPPALADLHLCVPPCPDPGYCITCLDPPHENVCVAVICPPIPITTPVTLASVTPGEVPASGGVQVTFAGTGFTLGSVPRLGGIPLDVPLLLGPDRLTGLAPRLPLGPQAAEITDLDGAILARHGAAVTVIRDATPISADRLPPGQIEGALAEGTARFRWLSPADAKAVVVLDSGGSVLGRFPPGAGEIEIPVPPVTDEKKVSLVSEFEGGKVSEKIEALARRLQCSWPPPLTGFQEKGNLTLPVYGGGSDTSVGRCDAPPSPFIVPNLTALGASSIRSTELISSSGSSPGTGSVITALGRASLAELSAVAGVDLDRYLVRSVTTGFTLEADADKLLLEAHYFMPVFRPGLRLKGRLMHVSPEDGFQDEFTLPGVLPSDKSGWNGLVYYRADGDVGLPGAQPCGLKIPRGEYIFQISAVGGEPSIVHFVFSTDGLNEEILIPGVPCPPYPLVKVTDLTGKTTLPVIERVDAVQLADSNTVQFVALGYWLDEQNQPHYLTKERPTSPLPFDFHWAVRTGEQPVETDTPGSNAAFLPVPQLGCFEVEVTALDPYCGRAVKRAMEVATEPSRFECNSPYYSCINPNPDPGGVFAVVGLAEAMRPGQTAAPNHIEKFRVFVVPFECCPGQADNCEIPLKENLSFRLATEDGREVYDISKQPDGVLDLCPKATTGPKFFQLKVNFDKVPPIRDAAVNILQNCNHPVYLEAMTVRYARPGRGPEGVSDTWRRVSEKPMILQNRPESLLHINWTGTHSPQNSSYQFVVQSSQELQKTFTGIQNTNPAKFLIDLIPGRMPELPSEVASGFNTTLEIVNGGHFEPKAALANLGGEIMGNLMDGSPISKAAEGVPGAVPSLSTVWEWKDRRTLFEHHFQHPIFKSILWTGVIIIIPVTIWGEMSLGFDFNISSDFGAKLAPFEARAGGDYFQSHFDLDTQLGVSLPATLRTDILFGIVSYALSVHADANALFRVHVGARNEIPEAALRLFLKMSAGLSGEVCLMWFLCAPTPDLTFFDDTLIDYTLPLGGGGGLDPASPLPAPLSEGVIASPRGGASGQGGVERDFHQIYQTLTNPVIAVSPDRLRVLSLYYVKKVQRMVAEQKAFDPETSRTESRDVAIDSLSPLSGPGPFTNAAAWISNDRALVLSTKNFEKESSLTLPFPAGHVPTREELNELKAQEEIVLTQFDGSGRGALLSSVRITDPTGEVLPPDRRADGAPAIAGDNESGDAIAAWVRYETREFLIEEASPITYYLPDVTLGGGIPVRHDAQTRIRPQLERTAIYTRRVGWNGVLDAPRKISGPGINAEPAIAFSPSGREAYCVWLNDTVHKDLTTSNRRRLVHSVWKRSTDGWSAPQPVLAIPDDYPGVLEPSIALKGDGEGLLAFNALSKGAEEWDSGLAGSNRFVYVCRLKGGIFGPPQRIHGYCGEQIAGRYTTQMLLNPIEVGPGDFLKFRNPDWVMFQETGPVGTRAASGNVVVAALPAGALAPAPAVRLTSDDRTHTNVTGAVFAGGLATLNLKGGPATIGAGGGGLPLEDEGYETAIVKLEPDLAITACTLSNRFPGAGAFVKARVDVQNRGLASSPMDRDGRSVTGVRIVYRRADGTETVETEEGLEVLDPGQSASIEFGRLEMPLDPVRLVAELSPNPVDRDRSNDSRECFFGAPEPLGFACADVEVPMAGGGSLPAVGLSWTNPALYDELTLFRDGAMLATLPGATTRYIDRFAGGGEPVYEIHGRIGASKSCRVKCGSAGSFRRGDTDGNGSGEITDVIATLAYLFLGGEAVPCPDAADADDNGELEITDAIRTLGYLFLGGTEPASPGPLTCGRDPSPDALGACRGECR